MLICVPLASNDGALVCQYQMTTLEELGLLKMDFLGLRNLTVLEDAARRVRRRVPDFQVERIPLDDKKTFDMLAAGRTVLMIAHRPGAILAADRTVELVPTRGTTA